MPGQSIIYRFNREARHEAASAALAKTLYFPSYFQETLHDSLSCLISCIRYEDYPIASFTDGAVLFVVEGRIYNKDTQQIRAELPHLAMGVFDKDANKRLLNWLSVTDGEFVVSMYNTATGDLAVFNDLLGRLSLYYHATTQELLLSRDIRFIASLLPQRRFDRMAMAQYLLLGYPLAQRTLFEDVTLVPPGSLIRANARGVKQEQLYRFNFEEKAYHQQSIPQNVEALTALFYDAIRLRADGQHTNVLSLSGGRDSRVIGAALSNLKISFTTATFLDYYKTARGDAELAGQAARLFDAQWHLTELGPTTGKEALQLLKIKSGLCGLRLCDILPFFEAIQQRADRPVYYFTGDGGAKFSDQRPPRRLNSLDALVQFITSRHQRASVDTAAAVTGVSRGDILDELRTRLSSYPERDMAQKHVHFMIYERAPKFAYESEDRNRCYFWSQSPLYALPVFTYVMNCPDEQKANYALYSAFMAHISREAASLTEQNVGLPITSTRYRLKHGVKQITMGAISRSPTLVRYAKNFIGRTNPYSADHLILSCLRDQIRHSASVASVLSVPAVETMLENVQRYSKEEFQLLLTIASAIEEFEESATTLSRYLDKHII